MALVILPEDNLTDFSKIISPKGISGGLYLGNIRAAQNISLLRKNKITAIITIGSQIVIQFDNKINHLKIDIDDSPLENINQYFELASQFIEKHRKNGNVFVHCKAGISRSASLVIAYLMKSKQYNFLQAYKRVKIRRNVVHPNQGFQLQLKDYQKLIIKQKQTLKNQKLKA